MQMTRRGLLSGAAAVAFTSAIPGGPLVAQVVPPPPPPPPPEVGGQSVSVSTSGSSAFGAYVTYTLMAKVFAIIMTAWYVGATQNRQLTLLEVLFAPFPGPAPDQAEIEYTMVAWAYDNLPKRREQHFFDVIGDRKPWTYPSLAQMKQELAQAGIRIKFKKLKKKNKKLTKRPRR